VPSEKVPSEKGEAIMSTVEAPEISLTVDEKLDAFALLAPHEIEPLYEAAAKKLKWRKSALITEVERRRKLLRGEEDVNLAGTPMVLKDVEPWDEPVRLSLLLDEITSVLRRYIIFQHEYDAWTLSLWIVVTYCSELFNIAPLIGVSANSKDCGKTSLLRILLNLVRKGKPSISLTRATAFRIVDRHRPVTLVCDEVDKWLASDPQLLSIFLAGHERAFSLVSVSVGDDHEARDFNVFGPKVWGMIGLPDDQLTSRSIIIKLLPKEPDQVVEDWPRIGMPEELTNMFTRLQRQSLRWMQDNVEKIKTSMPELAKLSNRLKDNWFPLYTVALLASEEWTERAIEGSKAVSVIDELTPQIILLRDIRNSFHTRGVDRMPSWLLLADLLLQPESPWKDYERQKDGLNSHQFGHLIRQLGIESYRFMFDRQYVLYPKADETRLRGYDLSSFETLIKAHLAGDQAEIIQVYGTPEAAKAA
jgi:hypothetical protein